MMDFINENLILVSLTIFVFLLAIFNELKIKEGNICGLSPVQAVKLINQNAVIFDLRNENDFGKKHLLDSQNIAPEDVPKKAGSLNKPLLLVCDTGGASKKAVLRFVKTILSRPFILRAE